MYRDLSRCKHSATSLFIRILPKIKAMRANTSMTEDEKTETAIKFALDSLTQESKAHPHQIAPDYIERCRNGFDSCITIDDVIDSIEARISNGKKYCG